MLSETGIAEQIMAHDFSMTNGIPEVAAWDDEAELQAKIWNQFLRKEGSICSGDSLTVSEFEIYTAKRRAHSNQSTP